MTEDIQLEIDSAKETMAKAIDRLNRELSKIRAGKANPTMLDGIMVDYYGTLTPLGQVANVNTPDAMTLGVKPWEKAMLVPISKSIIDSNLGLNPQNNGEMILISIPMLTEERRLGLVKQSKTVGEDAKISVRNARRDANDGFKQLEKDGLSEDMAKTAEAEIQKLTDSYVTQVDALLVAKDKDIMTV
jgi:ribosome recycling factor